ncbi:uncharacterized protein [Ptychodera flava]|uniref:uncharacterized protein n=1 Tax=Ptychodera flava TaxID=63121 RepID=UPI00396AAC9A
MTQSKASRKRARDVDDDVELVPAAKRSPNNFADPGIPRPLHNGHSEEFHQQESCHCTENGMSIQHGLANHLPREEPPGFPSACQEYNPHEGTVNNILHSPPGTSAELTNHSHDDTDLANEYYGHINQILREAHFARMARIGKNEDLEPCS